MWSFEEGIQLHVEFVKRVEWVFFSLKGQRYQIAQQSAPTHKIWEFTCKFQIFLFANLCAIVPVTCTDVPMNNLSQWNATELQYSYYRLLHPFSL